MRSYLAVVTRRVYLYTTTENALVASRDVISRLKSAGWVIARQRGSHVQMTEPGPPERHATIPHPVADLPIGTLKNIERQSGQKLR